jgi:hypothetical protein
MSQIPHSRGNAARPGKDHLFCNPEKRGVALTASLAAA